MANVEATVDAGVARVRRELQHALDRQEQEVRRLFERLKTGADGRLLSTAQNLAIARATGDELAAVIARIGGEVAESYRVLAGQVVAEVGAELAEWEIPPELSEPAVTSLQAQLGNTVDGIAAIAGDGAEELRAVVLEMVRTTRTPAEALDAVRGKLGVTEARAISLVDTSVSAMDRTVSLVQSSDVGISLFLLDGPLDSLTRPWCAEHVGKVHTQEQVAALANDTGPQPASAYAGGWNCRHRWVAVDEEEARAYPRWSG